MTKEQIFCFVGENEYALSKELARWKLTFSTKYGPENLTELQAKDEHVGTLIDVVSFGPFIAEKRLVIVRGFPKADKDEMSEIFEAVHPATVLLFVEPKPDKRLSSTKFIEKEAQVKEFLLPSAHELRRSLLTHAASQGIQCSSSSIEELITIVGDDERTLVTELDKLCLYCSEHKVLTEEHVELLAIPSGSQVIWKLTDLLGSGDTGGALKFFRRRIERGEDPYGIWVILLNLVKNLVLCVTAYHGGLRDERSISSAFGLHFLAVRSLLPLAKNIDLFKVKHILALALEADLALKSGGHHYAVDRPDELISLTESIILQCGELSTL